MATVQLLISDAYDQHDDNATAQSQIEVHIMLMFRYQRLSVKLVLIIPQRFLFLLEASTVARRGRYAPVREFRHLSMRAQTPTRIELWLDARPVGALNSYEARPAQRMTHAQKSRRILWRSCECSFVGPNGPLERVDP